MWDMKSHQTPRWDLKVLRKLPHTQINLLLTFSDFVRGPPMGDWVFMKVFRRVRRVIMLAVLEEKHGWFSNHLTQVDSKNRSRRFCETLINMSSWTWAKNKSANHMLSKGKLLAQQSHLTGCQDLNVLGQKHLKASVIIRSVLARETILHSESVKKISTEPSRQACHYLNKRVDNGAKNKVAFRGKC